MILQRNYASHATGPVICAAAQARFHASRVFIPFTSTDKTTSVFLVALSLISRIAVIVIKKQVWGSCIIWDNFLWDFGLFFNFVLI